MVEKNVRNDQWVKDMAKKVITRILVPLSFAFEVRCKPYCQKRWYQKEKGK